MGQLAGVARNLPNPHLLINPFMRREAVLSSRIEGTETSLSELFYFEAAHATPANGTARKKADVREVANYVHALEFGLARLPDLPVCLRLILEIHEKLMTGVRGRNLSPGKFRQDHNWIGTPGCNLEDATYVPPPPREMMESLHKLEAFLHDPPPFPPLIQMALVHCQFEAIHPFSDGNGRVGRLLIPLLLCAAGLLPQPLLYLSAFFEQHRDDYYNGLFEVSRSGAWLPWIDFFLTAVITQSRDAVSRTGLLLDLWQTYRDKCTEARSSALVLGMVDSLFAAPVLTIPGAAERLGVSWATASQSVHKLVDAGILAEVTGRQRHRVFSAVEIVDIIASPGPEP